MRRLFRRNIRTIKKRDGRKYTEIEQQALDIGNYYVKYMSTLSKTSKKFSLSVTTVWRRLQLVKSLDHKLYQRIENVKRYNLIQAPIRSKITKAANKRKAKNVSS